MPGSSDTALDSATPAVIDAITLLQLEHAEMQKLFAAYQEMNKSDAEQRDDALQELYELVFIHSQLESEIFYPAARAAGVEVALVDRSEAEHELALETVRELQCYEPDEGPHFDARVKELAIQINRHAQEEETLMFPMCRDAGIDLVDLGARLAARKEELIEEGVDTFST